MVDSGGSTSQMPADRSDDVEPCNASFFFNHTQSLMTTLQLQRAPAIDVIPDFDSPWWTAAKKADKDALCNCLLDYPSHDVDAVDEDSRPPSPFCNSAVARTPQAVAVNACPLRWDTRQSQLGDRRRSALAYDPTWIRMPFHCFCSAI
ncbi:hypothetical protein MRB53_034734 [Persea americana]|uniref:Uncharacterized protein n=1 Tax=Persea americana TaxID=3435 RepID=A0ACC2K350_PERAE|nr:hypothetical protein MRB53_034734 [Persea americana]